MCYRVAKFLLIALALLSIVAIFVPWQRIFFLTDDDATRCIAVRMILLPVPIMCFLGALWAGQHGNNRAQPHHHHHA